MALLAGLLALAFSGRTDAASFADLFAARETLSDAAGRLEGSNVDATLEPNEPRHGGKTGGRSVWIAWQAPADGVATFETGGSSFDTLLSAYYFPQPADTTLDKLKEAARNDDAPGAEPASLIQFGARAGTTYHIAVDGYLGASGSVRLRWDFVAATSPPPVIVSVPQDQAARQGDRVMLTVDLQTSPELDLQWRFNGQSFGETGPTLVLPSLQPTNVGRYTLRIRIGDVRFETTPTELQINSEGQTNALARDKPFDALASALTPTDGRLRPLRRSGLARSDDGVVRGYNGTQVFNTTYATVDTNEPAHCAFAPAATYWFAYQPPADGTTVVDTLGSTLDTFMAAYTYNPPLTNYAGLIPIACDDNSAGGFASRLEFATPGNRPFLVVVGGIAGARGVVHLNYVLNTNHPPHAPAVPGAPTSHVVAVGSPVTLLAQAQGSPPLLFQWYRDHTALTGSQSETLHFPAVAYADEADYRVQVWNYLGNATSGPIHLRVVLPPALDLVHASGRDVVSFISRTGQLYQLEAGPGLPATNWSAVGDVVLGDGSLVSVTNVPAETPQRFYRVQVQ